MRIAGYPNRLLLLSALTLIIANFVVAKTDTLIDIRPVGQEVYFPDTTQLSIHFFASYASDKHKIYVRLVDSLYTIDVTDGSWSIPNDISSLPIHVNHFGYSLYHQAPIFWDAAIGRVYLYKGSSTVERIDNSFEHRSQGRHAPWIDPSDGSIYAYGGYGLFIIKNIITRFDASLGDWFLVEPTDLHHHPSPINDQIIITDSRARKIFMIGDGALYKDTYADADFFRRDGRTQPALWQFDLPERRWYRRHLVEESRGFRLLKFNYPSVHPDGQFFLGFMGGGERTYFTVYDIESNRFFPLQGVNPNETIIALHSGHIFWSESDETFYALTVRFYGGQPRYGFRLFRIDIPDPDALLQFLWDREMTSEDTRSFPYRWAVLPFLVLFTTGLLYFIRRIRVTGQLTNDASMASGIPQKIQLNCYSDGTVIVEFGRKRKDGFQDSDRQLLHLLGGRLNSLENFITTDEIDAELWPDHPNPDYIRRLRNMTLARIERILTDIYDKTPGTDEEEQFILRRPNPVDKRRFEYRLNDHLIEINLD
jgi:hypothetical protein